jgi:hypothetical protein
MPSVSELQTRTIWVQWLPLAATWAMMAAEGLIIQSMLSRLPNASVELAAFGVAIGIAFIVESPIIMLLSASGYRARIRNHGHSCFLCEIVIRSQFHTTYEPEA